jgi:hypothetical protein
MHAKGDWNLEDRYVVFSTSKSIALEVLYSHYMFRECSRVGNRWSYGLMVVLFGTRHRAAPVTLARLDCAVLDLSTPLGHKWRK